MTNMKYLVVLLIVILFVSCAKNNTPNGNDPCAKNITSNYNNDYWSCEQLLDTAGLKLYPFVPLTEEERLENPFYIMEELRQIPEDFLCEMTVKELFYQFVNIEVNFTIFVVYNIYVTSRQLGFIELTKRLNMLPELLNRPDAGHVLLGLLQKADPRIKEESACFKWFFFLQMILSQREIINLMTDEEIDNYVFELLRCHNTIRCLQKSDSEQWGGYPAGLHEILSGLANVMIKCEFEPFIQTMVSRPVTDDLYWSAGNIKAEDALQIINYIEQFIKNRKKWEKYF